MHTFPISVLKDKATRIPEGTYSGSMTIHDLIDEAYKTGKHDGWYECLNGSKKETSMQYKLLKDLPDAPKGTIIEPAKINETDGYRHLNFTSDYMDNMPEWFRKVEPETLEDAVKMFLKETDDIRTMCKDMGDDARYSMAFYKLRRVYEATKK